MSTTPETPKTVNIRLQKVFRTGEGVPSLPLPPTPIFVNVFDFAQVSADILMDGGVVSPEALRKRKPDEETVECQVLFRVAMSVETLVTMRQSIDALLKNMEKAGRHVPAGNWTDS